MRWCSRLLSQDASALQWASDEAKGDRSIVLAAVSQDWGTLQWASDKLRGDCEIVLKAVSQSGGALSWALGEAKGDRNIVLKAVSQDWRTLQWASGELRGDHEIVMKAVSQDCDPGGLLQNRETGQSRKWLGRVLGRVLRKFGVLEGVLAKVLLLIPSKENPLAAPSPALAPAPRIFAALFPAPSPAIFRIAPFLYSVAGRPGRNPRMYFLWRWHRMRQRVTGIGLGGCVPELASFVLGI